VQEILAKLRHQKSCLVILYHHAKFQRYRSTTRIFMIISLIFWFWKEIFEMSLELQWWEIDPWSLQQKWCWWIVVLLWAIKWLPFFRCLRVKKTASLILGFGDWNLDCQLAQNELYYRLIIFTFEITSRGSP
jgi:hypothetical protein